MSAALPRLGTVTANQYALRWPQELFVWEANRLLALPNDSLIPAVQHLVVEAIQDGSANADFKAAAGLHAPDWGVPGHQEGARGWLRDLITTPGKLTPYSAPVYWAQREGKAQGAPAEGIPSLAKSFSKVLLELQELGYFPEALPQDCVDNAVNWEYVSKRASDAIFLDFDWDGEIDSARYWEEPLLYSLIEYFHDEAQRPRVEEYLHEYAGCGSHYGSHNVDSGGVVYRWRINDLLSRFDVHLRLGAVGEERGRLIKHFSAEVDVQANERVRRTVDKPEDEIALAIRTYRERGASVIQKRHALTLFAGVLEGQRDKVKTALGKDESDLFRIANNYGIRHMNNRQLLDYGEEFLDYLFTVFLAANLLMEELSAREPQQFSQEPRRA